MSGSAPFRLNRSGMLLALISAGFMGEAAALAGRVDFATSGVTVAGRDGRERPLNKGAELDSGDTVKTGSGGRAQIRFTDGSYVSLQPNTDFAISEYRFSGKPADDSDRGFYGLVRGAMRTVTGAIGRSNRNAYRITTPTATVGIRGTGGVIQVLNDGSTLVIGTSGIWSLTNPAGSIDVPAGVSGLAPSEPNSPPKETNVQPQTSTAPIQPQQELYTQGDNVNPDGTAAVVAIVPLASGTGYASALAYFAFEGSSIPSGGGGTAVFNAQGQLTELTSGGTTYKMGGSHADFGTDGILAWGRWVGDVGFDFGNGSTTVPYADNQGLHYVIGMPTAVMPTAVSTATYSLMGATQPTYEFGTQAPGSFAGQLTVTFGSTYTVDGSFRAQMPDRLYSWTGRASGTSSPFFSMSPSSVSGCASSGCSARVNGFFAGTSAERAGISYSIDDFGGNGGRVNGAAAFKKN